MPAWRSTSGAMAAHATTTVRLSLNNHLATRSVPVVSFCGVAIERINLMEYLGLRFDRSLGFKDRVEHMTNKIRERSSCNENNESSKL